ncbi:MULTISPECIES: NADPH-dependent oxidoreductase [Thermocrispum]|jgi:nitroreductase|uniref:NADPH-dependent oxidoreductase n=1 Tax=Thermocrispum agreste TaxID=37925 RepID=A0A2W4JBL8_9PSEU|nr:MULTISPECIES: NADPH-dependent oxidoreductase [Thermocrispum]PZM96500.1 MAG: NADPH-dependent oxidoreductase [Thermocrispum agreste]
MSATSASRPAQRQDAPGTLADELRQRFGDIDLPQYPASETIRVQLRHRSVRAFLPEKIPQDALDLVLMAAQAASHSSNLQAWSVVVVEDADRRRRVCEAIGGMDFINQASVLLVWVVDLTRAEVLLRRRAQDMETARYLEGTLVPFVDIGIAAQNALLAAESLGFGGVFIGALRNNPPALVDELGLPALSFPALGMALGVPDPSEAAGIKPRLAPKAVVHRERYRADIAADSVDEYEPRLTRYYRRFGVEGHSWAGRVVSRLGPREGLKGRHRMRKWLRRQGLLAE